MKKERLGFNLVLLGQIASGKDTQAKFLIDKYNVKPVESGKHWRKLAKEKSSDGDWLRRTHDKGLPAPVALMKKFLVQNIEKKPNGKDLLFVGNPRLKPEGQLLNKLMKEHKENYSALYISLTDREVFSRSFGRKERLEDENKKLIETRIKWHKDQVSKTVDYFHSLGKLKKINGNQSIEKVSRDIEKAIICFQKRLK